MNESKRVGSFVGVYDGGGAVTVHIIQEFIVVNSRGGETRLPGMKSLVTEDGVRVNRESQGVYETSYGLKITSDDPNAP
jgi:hypothetical protein